MCDTTRFGTDWVFGSKGFAPHFLCSCQPDLVLESPGVSTYTRPKHSNRGAAAAGKNFEMERACRTAKRVDNLQTLEKLHPLTGVYHLRAGFAGTNRAAAALASDRPDILQRLDLGNLSSHRYHPVIRFAVERFVRRLVYSRVLSELPVMHMVSYLRSVMASLLTAARLGEEGRPQLVGPQQW